VIIFARYLFILLKSLLSKQIGAGTNNAKMFASVQACPGEKHIRGVSLLQGPEYYQVSISRTFYEQLLHQNPFAKKLQTQIVST
jgi:hypothetical protein